MGVIAVILILFFGYRFQINKMVSPVKNIPVATKTIQPRTEITGDMIEYVNVAPVVLDKGSIITNSAAIIGKYSNYNTVIPKGSFFYNDTVIDEAKLPDSAFVNLKKEKSLTTFQLILTQLMEILFFQKTTLIFI